MRAKRSLAWHPGVVRTLFLVALLAGGLGAARADELKLVIILTRHGVRSPLQTNADLAKIAPQPWPEWETAPGIQTPRGNQLIALMGDYYRQRFLQAGLLTGDPMVDGPRIFVRADNDQRTIETARLLAKALVPVGEPVMHSPPEGTVDPLFRAFNAHVGHSSPEVATGAVLGRLGGDPAVVDRAYAGALAELDTVLYGPGGHPPADRPPTAVGTGSKHYLVSLQGRLLTALQATDSFILQYADGKPDVGWGRVDGKVLTDLLALHELYFELADRTFYPAQVEGSNLASHIVDTMEQAALGEPVPGAFGDPEEKVVILGGHDSNQANIGGLFGLNWWIDGTQANPMLPGGALLFEVWKSSDPAGSFFIRTSYVAQTLDQERAAAVLSLDHPPGRSPIFVPGCSGPGPNFDAPLKAFVRQARKVIDPAFIAPED